jgi:1-acyl-sn-glycerol-3-phosphate acyltransferase
VRLPPRWVRRPLSALLVVGLAFAVTLLPLLVLLAIGASALLPGRWRAVRLLAFVIVFVLLEVAGLAVALVLWVASGFGWRLRSPAFQRAHYAVLQALLGELVATARVLFHLHLDTDGVSWSPLDDGVPGSTNAMLVLSRHAGPGDSLLLVHTLLSRDHDRQPRIVLKDLLQWDPLLDVYLNRLPNAFLGSGREMAARVGDLAHGLGEEDALLIFPEGGNFTEGRRRKAIDRLRGKGMHVQATRAEAMRHVLPPRPGGVMAALAAAPHADVVFVAHTGLEHLSTAGDVWQGLPMDATVRLRWWFVPADEVPRDPAVQEEWLYERWAEIDRWIAAHDRLAGSTDGRRRG